MRNGFLFIFTIVFFLGVHVTPVTGQTFCNPLDLPYQYSADQPVMPSVSDPTIVFFKDNYFLFASNIKGYWCSGDLLTWKFISESTLRFEKNMEPTATVIGDWLYFFSSGNGIVYRTKDAVGGKWEVFTTNSVLLSMINDFTVFADTDGRVYCYYGCSNNEGVMARELDPNNFFNPLGVPVVCSRTNPMIKTNKKAKITTDKSSATNLKGSWMNKYNGKYYYQCTELSSDQWHYCETVYVSDTPMGPFIYAANNPFLFRPDGFISGSGSGSTFADKYGNWWHISTVTSPVNRETPSRLGLFPAGFDKDENLFAKTDFGDYPIIVPNHKYTNVSKLDPEWAQISEKLNAQASSSSTSRPVTAAIDNNLGTFWSAQTAKKGEWLSVDLGSVCTVNALQLIFAENKAQMTDKDSMFAYQYLVEYSLDKKSWIKLIDKTANTEYQPNSFQEIKTPIQAQYLRITNYNSPKGPFAISEFRIFGLGADRKPKRVSSFRAIRDYRNPQIVKLSWEKQPNTLGYNIRYGTDKDKLYHSYQMLNKTKMTLHCPDKVKTYWIEIDAFNENGVTPGKPQICK